MKLYLFTPLVYVHIYIDLQVIINIILLSKIYAIFLSRIISTILIIPITIKFGIIKKIICCVGARLLDACKILHN